MRRKCSAVTPIPLSLNFSIHFLLFVIQNSFPDFIPLEF